MTEKAYWTNEAYSEAISSFDVGLVKRNIKMSSVIEDVLDNYFDSYGKFLDYAGGYGLFVRLMRDKGFDFYRHDKYCINMFANHFDISDINNQTERFELVTAFEFLEHIDNPIIELKKIFKITDSIFITTELIPVDKPISGNWWYFIPESGQHIMFYTEKSLIFLAKKLSVNFYSDGKSMHIFTRRKMKSIFKKKMLFIGSIMNKKTRNNLVSVDRDFDYIKSIYSEQCS
ncbi:class I SAM-dependent methyltransferase [Desulfobulbus sp. F3]|nr:class I SAM-dependent methyltransferase [Desulfobulbus sp. F3]